MDVILDSNLYLSDVRMESIKFKNLFDYLRRTKSRLVLPRLVREEVIARHKHLLENQAKKTQRAVDDLNKLIVHSHSRKSFSAPNSKYEARALRQKFRAPSKKVVVRYYPETDGVDIAEVYLRGVNRRRPANSQGEELRDVILWLVVLQYAQAEGKEVVLITSDKGFWEGSDAHAHLLEDIEKTNVSVRLFQTIEDFVRDSAPTPTSVNEGAVFSFFDVTSMSDAIADAAQKSLVARPTGWGASISAQSTRLIEATFSEGTVYQINEDAKFFELAYKVLIAAQVSSGVTFIEPLPVFGVAPKTLSPTQLMPNLGTLSTQLALPTLPAAPRLPTLPDIPPSMPTFYGSIGKLFGSSVPGLASSVVTKYLVTGTAHIYQPCGYDHLESLDKLPWLPVSGKRSIKAFFQLRVRSGCSRRSIAPRAF